MKLEAFLEEKQLGFEEFGKLVGASTEAVRLWVKGHRRPNQLFMQKIYEATEHKVEPNDFFEHKPNGESLARQGAEP